MQLTAPQRTALKSALRAVIPASDPVRSQISAMSKDQLLETARARGVDVMAAIAGQTVTAGQEGSAQAALAAVGLAPDTPAAPVSHADPLDTPPAPAVAAETVSEEVDDSLATEERIAQLAQSVMEPMGRGDLGEYKQRLEGLARNALTRRIEVREKVVEVERIVEKRIHTAPDGCGPSHVPTVTGRKPLKALWPQGIIPNNQLGRIELDVYDAPDAPQLDAAYVWPPVTTPALSQLARGRTVMFVGPAGTGKTSWVEQFAARTKRPYVRIQCNRTTDAPELVGMTVPAGGDKGTRWQDGQLTAAIRRPGTVIAVEEPSIARAGALFVFQSLMDGARTLFIAETGEAVPVADGVLFVWADNTGGVGDETGAYAGTQQLNRATLDRIGATLFVDYMPADQEALALAARSGCSPELATLAVAYANRTRQDCNQGRLTHGLGLRRLIALCELVSDGVPVEQAYDAAIHRTAAPEDREALRQIWTASVVAGEWVRAAQA